MERKRTRKWHFIGGMILVLVVAVVVAGLLNRGWIYDWYRGVSYAPSDEMIAIREKLNLTNEGEFLFNAVQPELNEAKDFNKNCRQDESEIAVLGCYTAGNVYIYDIIAAELDGIRELTTAHELLHAKWARMGEDEKSELVESLTRVFDENQELLGSEIEQYDDSEEQEELYVRAGTEIKNLPDDLERHFSEIFNDQDEVVDFYESYIVVFREIKEHIKILTDEMEALKEKIGAKTANYERQANQLEADIVSFNSCAEVAGCFGSESEFYRTRNQLLTKRDDLEDLNDEIDRLIDEYNKKVEEYNADVTESNKLQDMVNSNRKVEKIN